MSITNPRSFRGFFSIQLAILIVMAGTGCDQLAGFHQQIRKSGHIEFQNPLAHGETGTLVGGTPKKLALVAPPETCFPNTVNGIPTELRFRDDTALPSESRVSSVGVNANLQLLKIVSGSNGTINAGVDFNQVSSMQLSFEGVHIEYMDSIKLTTFYKEQMGDICKSYLEQVAFIIQAIQAEKMSFKFHSKTGGEIKLTLDKIKQLIDLSADIKFQIERDVELVITSPKYLGYQLGKLQRKDNGFALYRATRTRFGRFVFEALNVFDPPKVFAERLLEPLTPQAHDANPQDFNRLIPIQNN